VASPAATVSLPSPTATVTISPALALALTAGTTNSTAADAGNGLTRTTTFQAGTDLSFTLTSSQDRQVTAKSGGAEEEQEADAGADGGVTGAAAEEEAGLWPVLLRTLNRFWPWADLPGLMPALPPPATPAAPAPDGGAALAPLDAVFRELVAADGALPAEPALVPAADDGSAGVSLAWLLPAVLLGCCRAPAPRDPRRRGPALRD
jgi:hypothetical protein